MADTITLRYSFVFDNNTSKTFDVVLDATSLSMAPRQDITPPEWTALSNHQCPNCPLNEEKHPQCPIALNLTEIIDTFHDAISFNEVQISIETESRTYTKHTALQRGLSSLVGIYMVTSGCPVMDTLRPMVHSHLPFASASETTYRTLSMYLLAQFFRMKKGLPPDWEMKRLLEIYEQIRIVNRHFIQRLKAMRVQDASLNALVSLDCFADTTSLLLEVNQLDELEQLFTAYLAE